MAKVNRPLGPRVTVAFGTDTKTKKTKYVYMLKSIATYYGFTVAADPKVKTKKGKLVAVRGTIGSGSIKVPYGTKVTGKKGAATKYKSIPVPAGATVSKIRTFLQKASKNKPLSFTTPQGRSYPLTSKK